jgi:hypothetical protein
LGFEDSFLLTWRDNSGYDRIDSLGLPVELVEFLHARNRDIPNIRCALGPYNSFFVHDASSYLWKDLPDALVIALQSIIKDGSWITRPRLVALGAGLNFILLTSDLSTSTWQLPHYPTLSTILSQNHIPSIHNIVLHPYRFEAYILQFSGGKLAYNNIPPHQLAGVQSMLRSIKYDSKEATRKPLVRRESERPESAERRQSVHRRQSVLQQRAQLRREWSDHSQEFSAQAKGVKLNLSLNISLGGIMNRMLG